MQDVEDADADEVFGELPDASRLMEQSQPMLDYLKSLMERELLLMYSHWRLM